MCPTPDGARGREPYILLYDDETVMDAIVALRDAEGQDWWRLIVNLEAGGYAVGHFSDLSEPLEAQGADFLKRALGELVGEVLTKVDAVAEQPQADADAVAEQAHARGTPHMAGDIAFGPGGFSIPGLFESSLIGLVGQYAEIPSQGTLSRRRLEAQKDQKKKKKKGRGGSR